MVEDGGLIRRSVGEKAAQSSVFVANNLWSLELLLAQDAMVPDDVESPDPPDDGHLSISTTFEAPDADAPLSAGEVPELNGRF